MHSPSIARGPFLPVLRPLFLHLSPVIQTSQLITYPQQQSVQCYGRLDLLAARLAARLTDRQALCITPSPHATWRVRQAGKQRQLPRHPWRSSLTHLTSVSLIMTINSIDSHVVRAGRLQAPADTADTCTRKSHLDSRCDDANQLLRSAQAKRQIDVFS